MMRWNGPGGRLIRVAAGAFVLLLISWAGGFAAEGGHGGGHGDGMLLDLLYRGINFALMVIIIFIVVRKTAVKDFFSGRREEIQKKLEGLKREKEAAEGRYQALEKKLKEFESQRTEILEQFKADGMVEKAKIIAEAEERAKQILAQADLAIQREIQAAGARLKQEVVDAAAQKAQEIIAREIKDSDQEHLINEFIQKVEKLH
jgi:F-type H+-transporting ATPase subunit b